ncbi:MAG TPA: NnrU family protein [Steroidobacteraceae bacterium]|nr:NnrU family protein [Steroidobacteraceae bacterium]
MLMLVAGVVLFFVPHSVSIVAPHWRDRMVLYLGEASWKGWYALLISAGLALQVLGFSGASRTPIVLYVTPALLRYAAFMLMLPVFPLLLATYLPGRILVRVGHPMLSAVLLWSAAHLLVAGTLPDVVLFGSFFVWALVDRMSLQRRVPPRIRRAPTRRYNDVLAVLLGVTLYALFVWRLHDWLFGVPL